MPSRVGSRTPAQRRISKVIYMYLEHIMETQAGLQEDITKGEAPCVNESFPSFNFFCASFVPAITLEKYVDRIVTYMRCSVEAFIFALAYIRRLFVQGFPLHLRSIHRIFLTAVVVAIKARDDLCCPMSYYSQVGGVKSGDLKTMELRFLVDLIDFRADVPLEEYKEVCNSITAELPMKRVSSSLSDVSGVTVSDIPSDSDETHISYKPQWIRECQLHW